MPTKWKCLLSEPSNEKERDRISFDRDRENNIDISIRELKKCMNLKQGDTVKCVKIT
jgi:hypothetical protein